MTVLSVPRHPWTHGAHVSKSSLAAAAQAVASLSPLSLRACVATVVREQPGGAQKQARRPLGMRPVRHSDGGAALRPAEEAAAFIFCMTMTSSGAPEQKSVAMEDAPNNEEESPQEGTVLGLELPPPTTAHLLAVLLPSAVALHGGLLSAPGGLVVACLPIVTPFSVPQMSPDSWMANKRARAFHRCLVFAAYAQGALALYKFTQGDLVGGTYLGLQAAMGAYAVTPSGMSMMPSYMMVAGFNGILGIIQTFQSFQGVPLSFIPFSAYLTPGLALLSCYWGWEFCQELRAIGGGRTGSGDQDTCWVNFMGGDAWPVSALSRQAETQTTASAGGEASRFSAFGGSGHRLGGGN